MNFVRFVCSKLPDLKDSGRSRKAQSCNSLLSSLSRYMSSLLPEAVAAADALAAAGADALPAADALAVADLSAYQGLSKSARRALADAPGFLRLSLGDVFDPGFLQGYEAYLEFSGLKQNTIGFYMSNLRSVYGLAMEDGLIAAIPGLFSKVFTGVVPTEKRALSEESIGTMMFGDLSGVPHLENCRSYFVLSSMLQGITFIDLAYLRPGDLCDNTIRYRRKKGKADIRVVVLSAAMEIIKLLMVQTPPDSPYLLPIITLTGAAGRKQYDNALRCQNRQLKDVAKYLGVTEKLTTYSSRHSWATLTHHGGTDVSVVSQCMGHSSEQTTRIYLAGFNDDQIYRANIVMLQRVLRSVSDGRVKNLSPKAMACVQKQQRIVDEYMQRHPLPKPSQDMAGYGYSWLADWARRYPEDI